MSGAEIAMLAMAAIQIGAGVAKDAKARKARRDYEVPDALKQSLALAKIQAADPNAPGYTQAKGNIDLTTANQLFAAQTAGNVGQNIQSLAAGQTAGYNELARMNAVSQQEDFVRLQQSLGSMADRQDLAYQLNYFAPNADERRQGENMVGAGVQNAFNVYSLSQYGRPTYTRQYQDTGMIARQAAQFNLTAANKYKWGAN